MSVSRCDDVSIIRLYIEHIHVPSMFSIYPNWEIKPKRSVIRCDVMHLQLIRIYLTSIFRYINLKIKLRSHYYFSFVVIWAKQQTSEQESGRTVTHTFSLVVLNVYYYLRFVSLNRMNAFVECNSHVYSVGLCIVDAIILLVSRRR